MLFKFLILLMSNCYSIILKNLLHIFKVMIIFAIILI
uniref:Uncharacterized protein n=1 Tax=Polysiphonia sertularioides TaxID=945028 RepID=A0A1Z1M9Q5_9FLOR|nr:hypothetical protein [Polysiphonia sertularioides]ARW62505.1 hypothetical protein [Polysiphonia sertularioides]